MSGDGLRTTEELLAPFWCITPNHFIANRSTFIAELTRIILLNAAQIQDYYAPKSDPQQRQFFLERSIRVIDEEHWVKNYPTFLAGVIKLMYTSEEDTLSASFLDMANFNTSLPLTKPRFEDQELARHLAESKEPQPTTLDIQDETSHFLQILRVLSKRSFHDPDSEEHTNFLRAYDFQQSDPDFIRLMPSGKPRNWLTAMFEGLRRGDGSLIWTNLGRPLPTYLHAPSRQVLPQITEEFIDGIAGAYQNTDLWDGVREYKSLSSLASSTTHHIYLQVIQLVVMWKLVISRIEEELPNVMLCLTRGLLPDIWSELVGCHFLFDVVPNILRRERWGHVDWKFPDVEASGKFCSDLGVYYDQETHLDTISLPSHLKHVILAVKSTELRKVLSSCIELVALAKDQAILSGLARLENWDDFLKGVPHIIGSELVQDIVQRVGFIGGHGILNGILTISCIVGQRFSFLPRNFIQNIISLTIAAADLFYNQGRTAAHVLLFDVDLRETLRRADIIAARIIGLLYNTANTDLNALYAIRSVADHWVVLPLLRTNETPPWLWLRIPLTLTLAAAQDPTKGSNLMFHHRILHFVARHPRFRNNALSKHVSPHANTRVAPSFLVTRDFLEYVPSSKLHAFPINFKLHTVKWKPALPKGPTLVVLSHLDPRTTTMDSQAFHESTSGYRRTCSKEGLMESLNKLRELGEAKAWRSMLSNASASSSGEAGAESMDWDAPEESLAPSENDNSAAVSDYLDAQSNIPPPSKRRRTAAAILRDPNFVLNDSDLVDFLPAPLAPAFDSHLSQPVGVVRNDPALPLNVTIVTDTPVNAFGIFRRYTRTQPSSSHPNHPQHDPEAQRTLASLSDIPPLLTASPAQIYAPFPNKASFLLSDWYWNRGFQELKDNFRHLLKIIGSPDFVPANVSGTNWEQIDHQLGINDWDREEWQSDDARWMESTVQISVPFHRFTDNPGARNYNIPGFYHLIAVIQEKITTKKEDAVHFHLEPYKLLWHANNNQEPISLYREIYSSPAFLRVHQDLQQSPPELGCTLPRVVVGLMFWSDATHLTQFGNAKITPLYMYFGNESKYRRSQSLDLMFSSLDAFQDFVSEQSGTKKVTSEFMAHCNREIVHEQWKMLLDDDFMHAYEHGIVLEWVGDGQKRRFYPRFMTYSTDYPGKVLMATIRQLGGCPCPRCILPKSKIQYIGTPEDRVARIQMERVDNLSRHNKITKSRQFIYNKNFAVDSAAVERELKPESLVPTVNMFSDRLGKHGFHWFSMFVVDLLHEIELGVWKALLIHLLRILESINENILHGLAKLRLHTSLTLALLDQSTTILGDALREFKSDICPAFATRELRQEAAARERRNANKTATTTWDVQAKGSKTTTGATARTTIPTTTTDATQLDGQSLVVSTGQPALSSTPALSAPHLTPVVPAGNPTAALVRSCKAKEFSLSTYKIHALGDYVATIQAFGTTDSYSTETGELEHKVPKANYKRTSKKSFQHQLARIERKQSRLKQLGEKASVGTGSSTIVVNTSESETDPSAHYHIGVSEHLKEDIRIFIRDHQGDPAIVNFMVDLQNHLLPRLRAQLGITGAAAPVDFCSPHTERIYYKNDAIYQHYILRVNYTSYDVRRLQDVFNPRTDHHDIMTIRHGIYHVNALYHDSARGYESGPHRIYFLRVRWFELADGFDVPVSEAWNNPRPGLDQVKFSPLTKPQEAFSFLDPNDVLRACHIVPRFQSGLRHTDRKHTSGLALDGMDWRVYYVNRQAHGVAHLPSPADNQSQPQAMERGDHDDTMEGVPVEDDMEEVDEEDDLGSDMDSSSDEGEIIESEDEDMRDMYEY
ncbi:hypothetical protein DXG01_008590 [Tephrocybe rancida]|nr:hypothetical protein DXG01_008590 [Tephrocybe rancida]